MCGTIRPHDVTAGALSIKNAASLWISLRLAERGDGGVSRRILSDQCWAPISPCAPGTVGEVVAGGHGLLDSGRRPFDKLALPFSPSSLARRVRFDGRRLPACRPWSGAHQSVAFPRLIACRSRPASSYGFDGHRPIACCRLPWPPLRGLVRNHRPRYFTI